MSLLRAPLGALAGRWLSLPASRCRAVRSDEWVTLRDGARLAAVAFRPEAQARCTLLTRSIAPIHGARQPLLLLAQLLAEQGHAVVVAGFRGLQDSEGRFEPFRSDGADAADVLEWLDGEPWCGGPRVLHGFGYAGHAAWAAASAARRPPEGLVVGFASRDPYAWLHDGGALRLEADLDLALALAAAEPEGVRTRDLARALHHRPVREADRVAARRIDWFREWLAHPQRDEFWQSRVAPVSERIPHALLIGGWYHAALPALLADHAALAEAAQHGSGPTPRLLLGPWATTPLPRRERDRQARMLRETARALALFLDRLSGDAVRADAPIRAFVRGVGWREQAHWPPDGEERVFRLAGSGRAPEGGRLRDASAAAPGDIGDDACGPDPYLYDPADATQSSGGASLAQPGEAPEPGGPGRGDTLRYASDPLERALEIAGSPSVSLHVESTATHTDFCAALLRIRPDGDAHHLCSGVARVALDAAAPRAVEISLSPLWQRLAPGDRLRLDVSSASFPRLDRHPNRAQPAATASDEDGIVARQTVHHDAEHPSRLTLRCVGGRV
jgi:putative CocE/NonD family hydrolase